METTKKTRSELIEEARKRYWEGEGLDLPPKVERPSDHPYYCPSKFE